MADPSSRPCLRRGDALLDGWTWTRRRIPVSQPLPRTPFPATVKSRVHSALSRTPYRVPHHLPASDASVGPTLLRFRHPSTASPGRAPRGAGFRPPPPRFRPQVFSTSRRFHGRSELAALFHAATVPGLPLPSEPCLAEIAHPSPGRLLPCGHPRAPCARRRGRFTAGFADALPISGALAGIPPRLWITFQRALHGWARLPVTAGPRAAGSRPTTRIIRFEASFPLQSLLLSPDGSPRREQPCSPGRSAPPEPSPPAPRTL